MQQEMESPDTKGPKHIEHDVTSGGAVPSQEVDCSEHSTTSGGAVTQQEVGSSETLQGSWCWLEAAPVKRIWSQDGAIDVSCSHRPGDPDQDRRALYG